MTNWPLDTFELKSAKIEGMLLMVKSTKSEQVFRWRVSTWREE
jgi:hypothetical protein